MFEFTENITIEVPDVKNQLEVFCESSFRESHKMIFEVAAIHEGLTSNYNHYGKAALEESLASWTEPYRKPILVNHDPESTPLGRVMKARMDTEADGSPFIRLQVAITDPEAAARIADERYLTGSVGGKAKSAVCSVCEKEWAGISMFDKPPCAHGRGKVYTGKLAYFNLGGLQWKEYSFVNVPADQRSGVVPTATGANESDGQIIYPAHIFALDMDNESIVEFNESAEPTEILDKLRKKEARFTYMDIKGTWLAASALEHMGDDKNLEKGVNTHKSNTINEEATIDVADLANAEESNMPKAKEEQEDVLAVLEELSDHLAQPDEKGDDKPEGQEDGDVELPINREGDSDDESADSGEESVDSEDKNEDMTEDTEDKGDESGEDESDESEPEDSADESAEGDSEETDSSDEELKDEDAKKTDESDEADEGTDDSVDATAELEARVEALTTENDKLKAMLHKILAERVVDRKIDLKMIEPENRAEALDEHITRTAASLADSYKDLSKQTYVLSDEDKEQAIADLRKNYKTEAALGEGASDEDDDSLDPTAVLENRLVDALMGRRSL